MSSVQDTTEGIVVRVQPTFSLAQSSLEEGKFVFSYHVELENQGSEPGQLLYRYWHIQDADGDDQVVEGEGVIGEQPALRPGDSHAYQSFCVLNSPSGSMHGHYTFVRSDGRRFDVRIPRFDLQANITPLQLGMDPTDATLH